MQSLLSVVKELKKKKEVECIIQFGSSLDKKDYRDIDLCLFTVAPLSLKKRLALLRNISKEYDSSFYEDLPLHLKQEVLSTGKVLFTKDYYKILQLMQYVDLEYPRYKAFLEDYHQARMAEI